MKFIIISILVCFTFYSCSEANKKVRIKQGNFFAEGNIFFKNGDTLFEGEIKYYDYNNKLVSTANYSGNHKNGKAINYYSNGSIQQVAYYFNDLLNGYRYGYNKDGSLDYKDYSYYGVKVGPSFFYEKNKIKEYYFSDFEGHTLFYSSYDSLGAIEEKSKKYFYLTARNGLSDSKEGIHLFLYLMTPPRLRLEYKICVLNEQDNIIQKSNVINQNSIFYKPFLPDLPQGIRYEISLDVYDSATTITQQYFKKIPQ